ncbi:MAG: galactokinase [Spirochaetes bacterium]|nr:galactokinase [Spirochaetota bacterium]
MVNVNRLSNEFEKHFGSPKGAKIYFSPGRINIIGEHIDYNGGYVLPAAIDRGIFAIAKETNSNEIAICSADFSDEMIRIPIHNEIAPLPNMHWGNYPCGIVKYLRDAGYPIKGMYIYLESTLPKSSGLSSSACLECLIAAIISPQLLNDNASRISMALLCQRVENEFVGVKCGIMDQMSIALGKKDHALLLNTANITFRHIPIHLGEYIILIMNTKKPRNLIESKYNERLSECHHALALIKKHRPIENLVDATEADLTHIDDVVIYKRARHVIAEQIRVQKAVQALEEGNLFELGKLLDESHSSLRNEYEVSGIELDTLVNAARSVEGCIGARMIGAGFGGCAIALVHRDAVENLINYASNVYREKTGFTAEFYKCTTSDGVGIIGEV